MQITDTPKTIRIEAAIKPGTAKALVIELSKINGSWVTLFRMPLPSDFVQAVKVEAICNLAMGMAKERNTGKHTQKMLQPMQHMVLEFLSFGGWARAHKCPGNWKTYEALLNKSLIERYVQKGLVFYKIANHETN